MRRPERLELCELYGGGRVREDVGCLVAQLVRGALRARGHDAGADGGAAADGVEGGGNEVGSDPGGEIVASVAATGTAARQAAAAAPAGPTAEPGAHGGLTADALRLLHDVRVRGAQWGAAHCIMAGHHVGGADEECERELEQEEEEEAEQEREIPLVTPCGERSWDWAAGGRALNLPALQRVLAAGGVQLTPLPQAVRSLHLSPPSISTLGWAGCVYVTSNFLSPVRLGSGDAANDYLRPLDAVLLLASGEAVLLSPREATGMLHAMQHIATRPQHDAVIAPGSLSCPTTFTAPVLTSLCYLAQAFRQHSAPLLARSMGQGVVACSGDQLVNDPCALVSMLLFHGSARYGSGGERAALLQLVKGRLADVRELLQARGKVSQLHCSDLEAGCKGLTAGGGALAAL